MAYINTTRSASGSLLDRAEDLMNTFRTAMQRRRVYKQTIRELNSLTSRELDDLGIDRSMISRIALEAAYGK
ncbi:MAG: DUF1127 domain-containing protein [Pseudorhodobacter sp.]